MKKRAGASRKGDNVLESLLHSGAHGVFMKTSMIKYKDRCSSVEIDTGGAKDTRSNGGGRQLRSLPWS